MADYLKILITGLNAVIISFLGSAQNPQESKDGLRIMFYNAENLFHPSDDSLKNDDEFTKEGTRYWSWKRYFDKINKIGKTALAIGEWDPPAVIGLCEIENRDCLEDLVMKSPLKKFGYEVIHHESGDKRGIDVALLYRPELLNVVHHEPFVLNFGPNSRPTRDILYVKGVAGNDTLHLFVNHWPSRYGGQLITDPKRRFAAEVLRSKFDSIVAIHPEAACIAMGDFNDHPDDPSMRDILKGRKTLDEIGEDGLMNLIWQYEFKKGTHKYDHEWGILDQFIVTPALVKGNGKLKAPMEAAQIFDADYLLEAENDGVGQKTNRTYIGFKYHGGYSDHLPIYMDVYFNKLPAD